MVALLSGWYLLKTDYEFTKYKLPGCNQTFTLVEYSAIYNRGAAIVAGNYDTQKIPINNCVKVPKESGFDAYYEFIVTCEKEYIIINLNNYVPELMRNSNNIIVRKLDGEKYQDMRDHGIGILALV